MAGEYRFFEWVGVAKEVCICASFTSWNQEPLKATKSSSEGKVFFKAYQLPHGIYSYLFIVDGEGHTDPKNNLDLDINGYNRVAVLPPLPEHLPRSIQGHPFAHLSLHFDPSVRGYVQDCIRNSGYDKNLISVKILEEGVVHACALMLPQGIRDDWEAIDQLDGTTLQGSHKLRVVPFQTPSPEAASPNVLEGGEGDGGTYRLTVGPSFPPSIIQQHLEEHFSIFKSKIHKIEQRQLTRGHSFSLTLSSLRCAKEAVATFHHSLLKGIQISVSLEDSGRETGKQASELKTRTPASKLEPTSVFVYSNPKFPNFVSNNDLREHFRVFGPRDGFIIKKKGLSTGVGKVTFPSRTVAEDAIRKMGESKVLGVYSISLKLENPAYPPKSRRGKGQDSSSRQPVGNGGADVRCPPSEEEHLVLSQVDSSNGSRFGAKSESQSRQRQQRQPLEPVTSQVRPSSSSSSSSSSSPSPSQASSSIKVSHLSDTITSKKLAKLFREFGELEGDPVIHHKGRQPYAHVNFKSKSAARRALKLNNTLFEGQKIAVKEAQPIPLGVRPPRLRAEPEEEVTVTTYDRVLQLLPAEWNRLVMARSDGGIGSESTTLLDEIKTPYQDNPGVSVELLSREKALKFAGRRETVNSCYEYFAKQIKKELAVDRAKMDALVFLCPSLPAELKDKYDVRMTGYCKGSDMLYFYGGGGTISNIEQCHVRVRFLLEDLHNARVDLESEFPAEKFSAMQEELKDEGVFMSSVEGKTVLLHHLSPQPNMAKVTERLQSSLVSSVTIPCKCEELMFLRHCTETNPVLAASISSLDEKGVVLRGYLTTVQNAESEVRATLEGLLCHKVRLTCNPKFLDHIKRRLLRFESRDSTFRSFIASSAEARDASSKKDPTFDIHVFCKDTEVYTDACKFVDRLNPGTMACPLPEGAGKIVAEMKEKLEEDYLVCINYADPKVLFHGLVFSNLSQCYAELRERVETTLTSTPEVIPISSHQSMLFRALYKEQLAELRGLCSHFSFKDNNHIQVEGTLKQVKEVMGRLKWGLLSRSIHSETFHVSRKSMFAAMWQRRWEQVKQQEKKRYLVLVSFSRSAASGSKTTFEFEVIGTDRDNVREVKEAILSEETQYKSMKLSEAAMKSLRQAERSGDLKCLDELTVCICETNNWVKEVKLAAPSGCGQDLDSALRRIQEFVGDHVDVTESISSEDPVVGLILQSPSLPYLADAHKEAERHKVTLALVRREKLPGGMELKITGTRLAVETAKPPIQRLTIAAIEKIVVQKQVKVRQVCIPVLTTPNFSQLKSKLETKFHTTCSLPTRNLNSVVSTSHIQLRDNASLRIEVVRGDITLERVDAIVNAANEDLQHVGGLAKAILDAGGPEIQTECNAHVEKSGKLKPGEAISTGAGRLPCKSLFHAVGPRWKDGKEGERRILGSVVHNCLKLAEKGGVVSLALPAISTGVFNMPAEECAKVSLLAVEDFAHDCPDTALRTVKFVMLSQAVVDAFSSALTQTGKRPMEDEPNSPAPSDDADAVEMDTQPSSPPTSQSFLWKWRDDHKSFSPYSSSLNAKINAAYLDNPRGSFSFTVQSGLYTIDFTTMRQINMLTKFKRAVTRQLVMDEAKVTPPPPTSRVRWQYEDDRHQLTPYTPKDSDAIEQMYQAQTPHYLNICGQTYTFNFDKMYQVNLRSSFKRKIRRSFPRVDSLSSVSDSSPLQRCAPKVHGMEDDSCRMLTLRGPRESLPLAERALTNALDSYIKQDVIRSLPDDMTDELREAISQIVASSGVSFSFEEEVSGGDDSLLVKTVLRLEGIKNRVDRANSEIYKELLHFKSAQKEREALLSKATPGEQHSYPPEWEEQSEDQKHALFAVNRTSEEWKHVQRKFEATMTGHTITKIERIQKPQLWERYQLSKKHLEQKNGGDANEQELFHGSRGNDPKDIYEDEDGFDVRCSRGGMWGRANYFAVNSSYSDRYSHPVHSLSYSAHPVRSLNSFLSTGYPSLNDSLGAFRQKKQIFLARVLVGESFRCDSNHDLHKPPFKHGTKEKYDSVSGYTGGSEVYMTYDNSHSYPAYLITYC